MQISYVGPFDEVEVPGHGVVKRNASISVPSDVAGHAPVGDPESEDFDPGVGLLAQTSNWVPAKTAKPSKEDEVSS